MERGDADYHQVVSPHRRDQDDADGGVPRITTAREPLAADMSRRESRYLIQMSVRVVCFLVAVFTWGHVPMVISLVLLVAAVVLPYSAVLFANAGRERDNDDVSYLSPREIGPGHDDRGGLGPAPTTPGRGPESGA